MKLTSTILPDVITESLSAAFDYTFTGVSETAFPDLPELPADYGIGLIVGPSGSGKTSLLNTLGRCEPPVWNPKKAIASHFASAEDAQDKLAATGLNSIPAWCRPFHALSTGEQFRADLAARLRDGACIDEFTSVVDRSVAKSCSAAVSRYIRKAGLKRVVFATCHYDIVQWLDPDWTYDTATSVLTLRGSLRRPTIELDLLPCSPDAWQMFRAHHYLSEQINRAARCWIAVWDGTPVGFASALAFPSAHIRNAWREHRTVVLPDFQGIGIGVRLSDAVAELFRQDGFRYFSKTAHPRMGGYRDQSPLWRGTSKNRKKRLDYNHNRTTKEDAYRRKHADRVTYSHEYVGA